MPEPTVKSARIVPSTPFSVSGNMDSLQARVYIDLTDGQEDVLLFKYYDDELRFSEHEFIGKTVNECHDLFTKKDIDYLRS